MKKVIDMYYGENGLFLKNDVYGLRRMIFLKVFVSKVVDMYYGKNLHFVKNGIYGQKVGYFNIFYLQNVMEHHHGGNVFFPEPERILIEINHYQRYQCWIWRKHSDF